MKKSERRKLVLSVIQHICLAGIFACLAVNLLFLGDYGIEGISASRYTDTENFQYYFEDYVQMAAESVRYGRLFETDGELDLDKEIVKKTLDLAEKYQKKVFALVSNMTIAAKRRDFLQRLDCFICNQEEAGILFLDDYLDKSPEEMRDILQRKVLQAQFPSMVVTMGTQGAVYADCQGRNGICPARSVQVVDTTGAGDAFCAGVSIGLTYGKDLSQAVEMGTYLAASVITSAESVCPRFHPRELGLDMDISS